MEGVRNSNTVQVNEQGKQKLINAKAAKRNNNGYILTDLDIAVKAGVSDKTVQRFFKGISVKYESAIAIAKALDLELTDLIDVKPTTPPLETEDDDLISAIGIDYRTLQSLLRSKKWREADQETARIMLKISGTDGNRVLYQENIRNFPCTDLRIIEQLWKNLSNGRFCLSAQKQIWKSLGGKIEWTPRENDESDGIDIWSTFLSEVSWTSGKVITTQKAPKGHFPALGKWWSAYEPGWLEQVFAQLEDCGIALFCHSRQRKSRNQGESGK